MGLTLPDKFVKFRDPSLNHSGEIRPKAVSYSIFGRFLNFNKCRPGVPGNVKSGVSVEKVGMNVCMKFGDSRSNRSRDIRAAEPALDCNCVGRTTSDERNERRTTSVRPCGKTGFTAAFATTMIATLQNAFK